jgi:hypothetical protein
VERAFTRIELLAVCAALLLVALVVAPAAVSSKYDSERQVCFNNLRLIGRGVQAWAGDHNQQVPWFTYDYDGGTRPPTSTKPGNAWFEYLWQSNELVTPKILACPSDEGVRQAESWRQFASATFRGYALSYPVHLHASTDAPKSWLSADKNFTSFGAGGCALGVNNASGIDPATTQWINGIHGDFGHLLLTDGSVEFTSSERFRAVLRLDVGEGQFHFLRARQ